MTSIGQLALVALGGGAGAAARALCAGWVTRAVGPSYAALGTLTVNVLGSFAMGLVAYWVVRRLGEPALAIAALVMTGFLGGFTTFSAFSLDVFRLLEQDRAAAAAAYILASVACSIAALFLGWALARGVAGGA